MRTLQKGDESVEVEVTGFRGSYLVYVEAHQIWRSRKSLLARSVINALLTMVNPHRPPNQPFLLWAYSVIIIGGGLAVRLHAHITQKVSVT